MSGRAVLPVPVAGADGLPMLGMLRDALSGAGPALAPHAVDRAPDPVASSPLTEHEETADDPVAAVVSTTGSTGTAKHVLLPASALLASAGATHDALGGSGNWLLPLPAHTVAGVLVLVRSLVAGTRPSVLEPGPFDPAAFVRATSDLVRRAPGRRYTSLVPAQLDLLLDGGHPADDREAPREAVREAAREALRSYDAVLVGGAGLPPALRDRARTAGVRVVSTYGMTETCGGCVYDGAPLPGVQVRVEPLDGEVGPDRPGRVVLGGPVVARGYRGAEGPAGPATGGEGFAWGPGVRWFRTADRGVLTDGVLRLRGRTDDVIVSGGVNVALDAVERVLRTRPGVRDCLVVALPSRRWGARVAALLVDDPAGPADDAAVRASVRQQLGSAAVPRLLHHVDRLPLTGVGKPDRATAVTMLAAAYAGVPDLGDHGDLHPPTEETT